MISRSGNNTLSVIKKMNDNVGLQSAVEAGQSTTPISYIEFQTKIIKIFNSISHQKLSTKNILKSLIASDDFLLDSKLLIHWPHRTGNVILVITANQSDNEEKLQQDLSITVSDVEPLLTLKVGKRNELIVEYNNCETHNWQMADIYEIVNDFNEVIRAKNIVYKNTDESQIIVRHKKNVKCNFDSEAFNKFIEEYQFNNITYKIHNVILNHSLRQLNSFTFFLKWPLADTVCTLKACFSRDDEFYSPSNNHSGYSWFITEKTLLNSFHEYRQYNLQPGQYYYSLKIFESLPKSKKSTEEDVELLNLWLTSDGLFGELHGVHKGKKFSGNEVLNIYKYFDKLFKVKKTFICDASTINYGDIKIPLRLILSLVNGKTWYQAKLSGVKLFDCKKFPTAHDGKVTQDTLSRNKALYELQNLTLDKWFAMLDLPDQKKLLNLTSTYLESNKSSRRILRQLTIDDSETLSIHKFTLKELAEKIYNQAKSSKNPNEDLAVLVTLLCDGLGVCDESNVVTMSDSDRCYWVKSRVNELIWGSFFWVKDQISEENLNTHKMN